MATLAAAALLPAGTSAGVKFLVGIGAAAFDAYVTGPVLFPPEDQKGPRLGDIRVNPTQQGAGVVRVYGNRYRVPGYLVWAGPLREVKSSESQGKGGSGGEFVTYRGVRSIGVQICGAALSGLPGGIAAVRRVWADGKPFITLEASGGAENGFFETQTHTNLAASTFDVQVFGQTAAEERLTLSSAQNFGVGPYGLRTLQYFRSGWRVDVSGFTGPAAVNNGVWTVASSRITATAFELDVFDEFGGTNFVDAAAPNTVTIKALGGIAASADFQLGSLDQPAHPLIVEAEADNVGTAADVYAARGRAMMWIDSMDLTDYGNRVPNFEFDVEVDPGGDATVAEAIRRICLLSGLSEEQIDVSGVTGTLEGFQSTGIRSARADLSDLMSIHGIVARDEGTRIVFQNRESVPILSVDAADDDVGCYSTGANAPQPLRISETPIEVPREINLTFPNSEDDFQTGHRRARYEKGALAPRRAVTEVALTLEQGQQAVDRLLAMAHNNGRTYEGTLSPHLIGQVQEGTILRVANALGETHDVMLAGVDEGVNGILSWRGSYEDAESLSQAWEAESTVYAGSTPDALQAAPGAPLVDWHILDIPALFDEHRTQPGVYVACACSDPSARSLGFLLYTSTDAGSHYALKATLGREAVVGRAVTAPSGAGIAEGELDETTTLRVQMHDPVHKLYSTTTAEAALGHCAYLWGDEIIFAATATLVSSDPNVYDLTDIYRGMRDTGDAITTHAVGDRFIRLDAQGVHFVPLNYAAVDQALSIKVVAHGGNLDEAVARTVTPSGRCVLPFRVADLDGSRNGEDSITITWARASRAVLGDDHEQPLDEDAIEYRVDVYDDSLVFVKTVTGITEGTWQYTAAAQTSDGLTPGNAVTFRVFQKSTVLDFVRYREITVAP